MEQDRLFDLLRKAQSGDNCTREKLIESYRLYVREIATNCCQRKLEWENDDELSIALLALNEAIDNYQMSAGKKFSNYVHMVVKSRLIDYFRKESRHRHLPLEGIDDEVLGAAKWEAEISLELYQQEQEAAERAEEMILFEKLLDSNGLSMSALEKSCPKHSNTRDILVKTALMAAKNRELAIFIRYHKKLPVKELSFAAGVSKKVINRGKQYILAVFLIITHEELSHLRSLFSLPYEDMLQAKPGAGSNAKGGGQNA